MLTMHRATALLRLAIIALFTLLVVFETLSLPGQFRHRADLTPAETALNWGLAVITVAWAVALQAALVMAWRLLTLVRDDRIFTTAALHPLDVLVRLGGSVAVSAAVVLVAVGLQAEDPGGPVALTLLLLCVTVAWLIVYVLRDVTRRAIGLADVSAPTT